VGGIGIKLEINNQSEKGVLIYKLKLENGRHFQPPESLSRKE
jgi:hypothetical protein